MTFEEYDNKYTEPVYCIAGKELVCLEILNKDDAVIMNHGIHGELQH